MLSARTTLLTTILAASALGWSSALFAGDKGPGGDWRKVSDQDGIIVYEKNLEGSDVISLRGEATIAATPQAIADTMKDNDTAQEWMPLVAEKRTIKNVSMSERIEYTHIAMPWPVTDRYFINFGKAEYLENGTINLSIRSFEQPEKDWLEQDKVLGVLHQSLFVLAPIGNGKTTHMTLEVNSDPKGMIPKWLVNMAQKSWPRDFFTGLIKQLEKTGRLSGKMLTH